MHFFQTEVSSKKSWSKRKCIRNMQIAFLAWLVVSLAISVCLIGFCSFTVVRVKYSKGEQQHLVSY